MKRPIIRQIQPIFAIVLILSTGLWACDPAKKYSDELSQLDNGLLRLDTAATLFEELPLDTLERLFKKVKGDMAVVQNTYTGEMSLELGTRLSRYRDIPNNIKNLPIVRGKVANELKTGRIQLTELKEAILSGANKDSQGNKIDGDYLRKNVALETDLTVSLVEEIKRMKRMGEKAMADYELYFPEVGPIIDSLKTISSAKE